MLTGPLSARSNLATWREQVELTDEADGTAIDIVTEVDEITVSIRDGDTTLLTATLTGGDITVIETGVFEFVFSATDMGGLDPKTYEVGCLVKFSAAVGGDTEEVILGTVPVLKGL